MLTNETPNAAVTAARTAAVGVASGLLAAIACIGVYAAILSSSPGYTGPEDYVRAIGTFVAPVAVGTIVALASRAYLRRIIPHYSPVGGAPLGAVVTFSILGLAALWIALISSTIGQCDSGVTFPLWWVDYACQ